MSDKTQAKYGKIFADRLAPLGGEKKINFVTDNRTGARYCELHIKAEKLIELGTVDVPLDPEDQPDYRANREIVENAAAFSTMREDAQLRRSFSNIVAEFIDDDDDDYPLKIIGGQHRFKAISEALGEGIDEYHGVKLYFELDNNQRLDVQLISNTNISISGDLLDRMQETMRGPKLRNWAQKVGFLESGQDFTDKRQRGGPASVQVVRTFITNFYLGQKVSDKKFDKSDTSPVLPASGQDDAEWEAVQKKHPKLWEDKALEAAAKSFTKLAKAQKQAFAGQNGSPIDFREKAFSFAVLAAWAFVAGVLQKNQVRLARHFALADVSGKDPLNAAALAKGRHKSDAASYRGLGARTDAKERGRLAELFFVQAEDGSGIAKGNIDVAIAKYHAKQAYFEVEKAKAKA